MIHLHTLGDTLITVGEKEVRPSAPMIFAALLYLGVERGRRVPRAALQELFFPEADERSGAHNVRQLLYKLRQLGAPLSADQSSVSVSHSAVLDDCIVHPGSSWSHREATKAALGFVPDYAPRISDRFSRWLEDQRATVQSQVRAKLAHILAGGRKRASWTEVADVARILLKLDPLNEEATLTLAEATAATGSKHQALDLLSAYERETGAALHLAPTLVRTRISNIRDPACDEGHPGPFIGRSDEIAALLARLSNPERFVERVNVVLGEPGIGKSRILDEVRKATELAGGRVLIAKCRPDHENRPLSVFISLVPALLQCRGALGVSPQALGLMRQLVEEDRNDNEAIPVDDDLGRSEALRRALLDLIDAVANEERLLLAVEDAHWCDAVSLRELRTLASAVASLRVLVTSRSLDHVKIALVDVATVFRLQPLASAHMAELAGLLLGHRSEEPTRKWCVEVAAGNPLFLHMLCGHVVRTGSCTVPKDLKALIASRLVLLPALHLRALQYVALLGEYATVESLRHLLQLSPSDFVACIISLEEHGYFQSADGRLRLTHDLVNEVAQGLATSFAMKALHAHVAMFLEERFESTRNIAALWDCAEQWRLSGEPDKSISMVRRCAAHACAIGQSTRALELLSRAKALTKDSHHVVALLSDMMLAAKAAGQLNDVLSLHRELRTLTREQHSDTELLGLEAEWLLNGNMTPSRLLDCVRLGPDSAHHRLEACILLMRFAHETCDECLARDAYSAVLDVLHSAPAKQRLLIEVTFQTTFGDPVQAARAIAELHAAIPTFSLVADQLAAARNVAVGLLILGRGPEAVELANQYRQVARDLGLFTREYEFKAIMAACYLASQDFDNGRRWASELEAPPDSRWLNLCRQINIELALADKNEVVAGRLVAELKDVGYGRMARNRSCLSGAELRLKQLNPDFVCETDEFATLLELHELTKRYISDDDFVCALAEDRRRRRRPDEALALLDDYVLGHRRQCWILPRSFSLLRSELQATLRQDSVVA